MCSGVAKGGGHWCMSPRRHTGKNFKSMDLLLLAMKDRYAFSICLQLLGSKPPDPMFILGIHGGNIPPKNSPQKNLSSFFVYLGLELSSVKKANNKTVV